MNTHGNSRNPLNLVTPELRAPLETLLDILGPQGFFGISDLETRRARYEEIMAFAASRGPDSDNVIRRDFEISRPGGVGAISLRHYRHAEMRAECPGILYIHGGGMIMGSIETDDGFAAALAESTRCPVVSVGYGLAPENDGTGPVEDCYFALQWMHENARELGADAETLALYGGSAGGGLACGTSLLARDRGGPRIAFQMLLYPMLDDRSGTRARQEVFELGIWDPEANAEAWRYLLGDAVGTDEISPYAAPSRAADLSELPPTYIDIGSLDLFFAETFELAQRLRNSGVTVELHLYPGAYHGFDQVAYNACLTKAAQENRIDALKRALGIVQASQQQG